MLLKPLVDLVCENGLKLKKWDKSSDCLELRKVTSFPGFPSDSYRNPLIIIHKEDTDYYDVLKSISSTSPLVINKKYRMIFSILYYSEKGKKGYYLSQAKPFIGNSSSALVSDIEELYKEIRQIIERYSLEQHTIGDASDKSIEFAPEHKQAGLQILNYFQETLDQKYPDNNVTVRFSQKGNTVTMEIETPDGKTELYEKALEEYGLVVTGQKPVGEYLPNKIDQMALEFRMKNISIELEFTNKLLTMKDQVIGSHERTIDGLNEQIRQLTTAHIKLADRLADIAEGAQKADDPLQFIRDMEMILNLRGEGTLTLELDTIREENPGLFSWLGNKVDEVGEKVIIGTGSKGLLEVIQNYF
ncbi:MAG: hypothetical protein Roseis2KO_22830 [Roseivirga sp.]